MPKRKRNVQLDEIERWYRAKKRYLRGQVWCITHGAWDRVRKAERDLFNEHKWRMGYDQSDNI